MGAGANVFLIITFCHSFTTSLDADVLHVGCLFQNSNNEKSFLEDVARLTRNDKIDIVKQHGYNVKLTFKDSGCNSTQGLRMGAELLLRGNVSAIIGPSCNEACEPIATLASFSNTPMVSYGCSSNNINTAPNYIRIISDVMYDLQQLAKLYSEFIYKDLKWKNLTLVYTDDEPWSTFGRNMRDVFQRYKEATVKQYNIERYKKSELLQVLQRGSRIILFACKSEQVADYFRLAMKKENDEENDMLYTHKYAFLTVNFDITKDKSMNDFNKFVGENTNSKNRKFGFLNMALNMRKTKYKGIVELLSKHMGENNSTEKIKTNNESSILHNFTKVHNDDQLNSISSVASQTPADESLRINEAGYVYDSIYSYLLAINKTVYSYFDKHLLKRLREQTKNMSQEILDNLLRGNHLTLETLMKARQENIRNEWYYPAILYSKSTIENVTIADLFKISNEFRLPPVDTLGEQVIKQLTDLKYEGVTGWIQFTSKGDRYPMLSLDNVVVSENPNELEINQIFQYNAATGKKDEAHNISDIIWPDGTKEKPEPNYNQINDDVVKKVLMGLFIPVVSFLFVAVGYRIYRNQKYEGDLMNKDIIFKFKELEIPQLKITLEPDFEGRQEKRPLSPDAQELCSSVVNVQATPKKKKKKIGVIDLLQGIGTVNTATGVRTFFATFRMDDVFVKQIPKPQVLVTREILVELKDIRDLRHANLNPYDGVCVGPPYVLLISAICKKGTLLDILQTEDIQLNWVFRYTFATDIANGLQALHESPLKYHGHLTSRNVLVDSRWNCKITGYGLHQFKQVLPLKQPSNDLVIEGKIYEALLWTSPENIQYPVPKKSKEGDIYSFGIILAEIINRSQGFSSFKNYTSRDIVHFIQKRCIPPFRPHVRLQSGLDGRALDLMRSCWDEFPENRPTIGELRARLKTIHNTKTNSKNLLDDMIDMMEKYAHDLEVALNERTIQLTTEKDRSEEANFMSLPENVADHLKTGSALVPQVTNNATVMLIKIDDIIQYCRTLTPQQVVDVLDDVHRIIEKSCDSQVMQFMYHKDRHGIGCGLLAPVRFHASRVGKIALKIMGSLTSFGFRHIKREELQLCIAIHSGEFIVGIQDGRVPTFIVLGKTLQYLENILEGTPKLRIFITGEALKCIKLDVGPNIEPSGHILVKGYGSIQGHFLLGIKGVNVTLPKLTRSTAPKVLGRKDSIAK